MSIAVQPQVERTPIMRTVLPDTTAQMLGLLETHFADENLHTFLGDGCGQVPRKLWEQVLAGPLREFLSRPGKGFRARLVLLSWRACGGTPPFPRVLPLLVELLHAGSLIVDDIEDGAVMRRNGPALHRLYGTPQALNVGNWLYFWPSVLVDELDLPPVRQLAIHRLLGATLLRCHHGQALDLAAPVFDVPQSQVRDVVLTNSRLKTGSLMAFAGALGAVAAGAPAYKVRAFDSFGSNLGVALQMFDDLGSVQCKARLDKAEEDLVHGRPTWPWAVAAMNLGNNEYAELRALGRSVARGELAFDTLRERLEATVLIHGRQTWDAHLTHTLNGIRAHVSDNDYATIVHQFEELEKSYG